MAIYKPGRPVKYNPSTSVGKKPPSKPGEYRIRDNSGQISYVGETNNLARRMYQHQKTGKLPTEAGGKSTFEYKLADGRSSSRTRRIHEREKIAKHTPYLNKSGGGEGRIAKKKGA
ncbi:MAG: GIY-YIG nuclease family protein [Clostridia bacterium]|nr:GIY-YIG nuclease family protein [Clostridia bacterium]